jgi:hypothetical protein
MVESTYPLESPHVTEDVFVGAVSSQNEKPPVGTIAVNHNEDQENYTLVGSWHNVMPKQNCVLKVRYQATPGTRFERAALRPAS